MFKVPLTSGTQHHHLVAVLRPQFYLLVVYLQVRHGQTAVPAVLLLPLGADQVENLPHGSGDHPGLLRAAQHGMSLTCGPQHKSDLVIKKGPT